MSKITNDTRYPVIDSPADADQVFGKQIAGSTPGNKFTLLGISNYVLGKLTWLSSGGRASAAQARTDLGLATVAATGAATDLTGTLPAARLPANTQAYENAADSAARRALIGLQFAFSAAQSSGLSAYFLGGTLPDASGAALTVASGAVVLPASTTSIVGIDLFDLTLRALPRAIDTGFIPVARVTTDATTITTVVPLAPPALPANRLARTKARLAAGAKVRVLLIGDSITAGTGGTAGNLWFELCFDSAQSAKGYNVTNAANVTTTNLGISACNAYHGVGSVADLMPYPSTIAQHPLSAWTPTVPQLARAGITARPAGANLLTRRLPDLVVIGLGTNSYGMPRDAELLEIAIRRWRQLGVDVLVITTNSRTDGFATAMLDSASTMRALAETNGAALADTWAEIAQARLLGAAVTPDGVHPADIGQLLYARAIRRNLNSLEQMAEQLVPGRFKFFRPTTSTQRVRPPSTGYYQPYILGGGGAAAAASVLATNYNVALAGQSLSTAVASLGVGGQVLFQTPACASVVILYELASGQSATVKVASVAGDIKTGIVLGGLSNRTVFAELISFAELEALAGGQQPSGQRAFVPPFAGRIEVTALGGGATSLNVQGMLFLTWDGADLDPLSFERSGTWSTEAARNDSSIIIPYTDTANSEVVIPFEGDALQLTLQTGSVSGSGATISAWVDDELVLSAVANDPYGGGSTGNFCNNVVLMPRNPTGSASGEDFAGRNAKRHTARVRLTAAGSTGASAQNRNLAIASARALTFA